MSTSNHCTVQNKNHFPDEIDDRCVTLTLIPITDEPSEEVIESNISSAEGNVNLETPINNKDQLPQANDDKNVPQICRKKSVSPLPAVLPPINEVSRDALRHWCQQFNLSTDGQKIQVYLRLLKNKYPEQQNYIPKTPKEARLMRGSRNQRKERSLQRSSSISVRWCVVHGRLLPADAKGWVRLQFCAGLTWVPDTHKTMISLFLLPACSFPSPELEDNTLCPECVERNKKMRKITCNRR
ncbi:developmental pluripotency-associated protein 2-like [Thomomys bottae]